MSVRRFNYTDRKKVERSDVRCSVQRRAGSLEFSADISLAPYSLPQDADVVVEAMRGIERQRFSWGTVGGLRAPADRSLARFSSDDGVSFRLVVSQSSVANTPGVILAEAHNIKPEIVDGEARGGRSLLPVAVDPTLGQRLWRIDFVSNGPLLHVNPRVGGKSWCATAEFRSAVLPACVREVLTRILLGEMPEWPADEPDDQDWRSLWLWFACSLPSAPAIPEERESYEDITEWLDDIVDGFARQTFAMDRWADFQQEGEE